MSAVPADLLIVVGVYTVAVTLAFGAGLAVGAMILMARSR